MAKAYVFPGQGAQYVGMGKGLYESNAKAKGLKVIGLTGAKENKLMKYADVCIRVPETETYKIQELHLPVYHCLCLMLEEHFFGTKCDFCTDF